MKNRNIPLAYLSLTLFLTVSIVGGLAFSPFSNKGSADSAGSAGNPTNPKDKVMTSFKKEDNPFSDIDPEKINGKAAIELYRRGVIGGFSNGTFGGDKLVNRAEASKFLLLGKYGTVADDASGTLSFKDVAEGAWYLKYINTASTLGIINGYKDNTFRPGNNVNAAEFLKMLTLTFAIKQDFPNIYLDVKEDDWFAPFAGIATKYNLFPDRTEGNLRPGDFLTRDEVAIAIYQYLLNSSLYDFGDASDPSFPSTLASNGARHIYTDFVFLGKCATKEYDALTPDNDQCDDGIVSISPLRIKVSISDFISWTTALAGVTSFTISPFYINILMDRNNNGTWEPNNGEWVVQNKIWHIGNPSLLAFQDLNGNPINWNPSDDGRIRITISSPLWDDNGYRQEPLINWNGSWPTAFLTGETEDYLTFTPPYVAPTAGNPISGGNEQYANVQCPLSKDEYPTVVNFNRSGIKADSISAASQNGPMPLSLPAGNYEIALSSFDTHSTLPQPEQLLEQWFLTLIDSSGATIGTTQAIGDLPDGTNVLTQVVETNFSVTTPISSVLAVHSAYPATGNSEDILPVCAGFKPKAKG